MKILRERDDIGVLMNIYRKNPTEDNLQAIIRYRPQDRYDAIHKKVVLEILREERKNVSI